MLVKSNVANAATKDTIENAHSKIVHKTGSRMNIKQHAMG
jgi:hypothetical protein